MSTAAPPESAQLHSRQKKVTPEWEVRPREILQSLDHLRITKSDLKLHEDDRSESGGGGTVVLATFKPEESTGFASEERGSSYVAVKKFRFSDDRPDNVVLASFAFELELLSDLHHPNVVKAVGFVEHVRKSIAWIVFDWHAIGDLKSFVKDLDSRNKLDIPERISLIHDIISGVSYLHDENDPPICHGDLKSLNILITEEYRAVISDFGSARRQHAHSGGLAKVRLQSPEGTSSAASLDHRQSIQVTIDTSTRYMTLAGAGTPHWMAPELLMDGENANLASDMWAFGWICWEVITGRLPFQEEETQSKPDEYRLIYLIAEKRLPDLAEEVMFTALDSLCDEMQRCWSFDPNGRSPAMQCKQNIAAMPRMIPSPGEPKLNSTTLYELGETYSAKSNSRKAIQHFQQSLAAASLSGNKLDSVKALMALGIEYTSQEDYDAALEFYRKAHELYERDWYLRPAAESAVRLAGIYAMKEDYDNCILSCTEAYMRCKMIKYSDSLLLAALSELLGSLYHRGDTYEEAEGLYSRALDRYVARKEIKGALRSAQSLQRLHKRSGRTFPVEKYFTFSDDKTPRVLLPSDLANVDVLPSYLGHKVTISPDRVHLLSPTWTTRMLRAATLVRQNIADSFGFSSHYVVPSTLRTPDQVRSLLSD